MSSTISTCAAGEIEVEVLDDAHHAAGVGGAAVGRDGHEVDLDGEVDGAGQVGQEEEGPLEHTDEQRGPAGVVGGDLASPSSRTRRWRSASDDHDLARWPDPGPEALGTTAPSMRPPTRLGHDAGRPYRAGRRRQPPAPLPSDPPAAGQLAGPTSPRATARTRATSAADGGWHSGRPAPAAQPPADGPAGQGQAGPRPAPGVGGVDGGGQRVEQLGVVRQQAGLAGQDRHQIAPGDARTGAGRTSWRTRLRRKRGSPLVGSSTGVQAPAAAHRAAVSRPPQPEERPPGRPGPFVRIPARPSRPAPRSRASSTVSAWSSMVWPVSTPGGRTS